MKKFFFLLSFLFIGIQVFSNTDSLLASYIKQREEAFLALKAHRDTITIRTWVNVVSLNGRMSEMLKADSLVIQQYASIFQAQENGSGLLDTIQMLNRKLAQAKAKPSQPTPSISTLEYVLLFVCSTLLLLLGIITLVLMRKTRTHQQQVQDSHEKFDAESKAREEYEKKLEDISNSLTEITLDREKTIAEIENINNALLKERQQKAFYSKQYEALSIEMAELKQAHEKALKDKQEVEFRLSVTPATNTDLITENNLLNSEIVQLKSKIELLHAQNTENAEKLLASEKAREAAIAASAKVEDYQKLSLEMDNLSQKLESTSQQLSKTLNEAETLRNAHTVNMSTIASMQQRLEAADKLLEKTRNECDNLKEDSKNLNVLRKEIETLNQEVIRWKEAFEENAQQLKQEIKLRKSIERDIQKIVGRFDSGQQ